MDINEILEVEGPKKRILVWQDSPTASTGFGVVAKYVVSNLYKLGYEIDQLGINYHGQFYNRSMYPWHITPAKVLDPRDPYGNKMFLENVSARDYDYIFVTNDTFVVHQVSSKLEEILNRKRIERKKVPIVIYYYPVDCKIMKEMSGMLRVADHIVCYTEHGRQETLKVFPEFESKLTKIHHGVNPDVFRPLPREESLAFRRQVLGCGDDTYVIINVNRNSVRKQIARTILAFKKFRELVPNSRLYLHTVPRDQQIDLIAAVDDLGLSTKEDVIFPVNYSPSAGYPEDVLNQLYNCADVFLTTHCGEGWGLTTTEAMSAGVPVIAPDNTSMPEILGNGDRGYIYPCREDVWIDNSGFRKFGLIEDIVDKLRLVYKSPRGMNNMKSQKAREWSLTNSWTEVNKQWERLFKNAKHRKENVGDII